MGASSLLSECCQQIGGNLHEDCRAGYRKGRRAAVIREIVALSVKFRVLVVGAAVVLLALGLVQLPAASVDGFPEFAPPLVQVQAEALGLSAAEVEQLITVPLEQDLLNGVPWLDQIRSESVPGLSTIDMIFEPGTDTLQARQMVQEHLTQAHALPQVGTPPVMIQPLSSTSRVMMIGLQAKDLSLIDLSILARWKIKPRLMGLTGVANVAIWGQRDRQLQVQVDPEQLKNYGVTLSQVVDSTGNALWVSPLTFVEASTPGHGRVHRHLHPAFRDPACAADHHGRGPVRRQHRGHQRAAR